MKKMKSWLPETQSCVDEMQKEEVLGEQKSKEEAASEMSAKSRSKISLSDDQATKLMRLEENHLIEEIYEKKKLSDLTRQYEDQNKIQRCINSETFNIIVSLVIIVNAITIGIETDMTSSNTADPEVWNTIEMTFLIIYIAEIVLRLSVIRSRCLHDSWTIFDFCIVTLGVIDVALEHSGAFASGGSITLIRMLRLLKLARLVRIFRFVRELLLLVSSIASAMRTLIWTWVLLGIVIYVFSIIYTRILGHAHPDDEQIQEDFGTITKSAFTLFAILTLEWVDITKSIWTVEPFMVLVTIFFITVTTFAIMNVVVVVIVESTIEQAMTNSEHKSVQIEKGLSEYTAKMVDVFHQADTDGSGDVTKDEFLGIIQNPRITRLLHEMELDVNDMTYLFDHLDINQNGSISLREFVQGTMQQRGTARAKRVFDLHCDVVKWHNSMATEVKQIQQKQEQLDLAMKKQSKELFQELHAQMGTLYALLKRVSICPVSQQPDMLQVASKDPPTSGTGNFNLRPGELSQPQPEPVGLEDLQPLLGSHNEKLNALNDKMNALEAHVQAIPDEILRRLTANAASGAPSWPVAPEPGSGGVNWSGAPSLPACPPEPPPLFFNLHEEPTRQVRRS